MKVACRTIVVKIASRCNLNCSYCYMYNLGDSTYKKQPKLMSETTINQLISQVKAHCISNNIKRFDFVIHGGEPLLAPMKHIEYFITKAIKELGPEIYCCFFIQTNGTLLTKEWVDLFVKYDLNIGISLDGNELQNDRHRVYHSGKGSYKDVVKGINVLCENQKARERFGILTVIDVENDPIELYDLFKRQGFSSADFLLPDHNHETPPKRLKEAVVAPTDYGDWYIKLFDKWFNDEKPLEIRFFSQIVQIILGGSTGGDNIGSNKNDVLVLETNGEYEAVDVLKCCGDGFTKTGVNVSNATINEALSTPLAHAYYMSHKYLPKKCVACPVNEICGAGYIPHRYKKGKGFNNPSIYCNDLLKLITHIQQRIIDRLPNDLINQSGLEKISYELAIEMINENMADSKRNSYEDILESF
jgi:uncharacterized protein